MSSFRGLKMFVSDIRAAKSKEAEQARVEKELAKIRKNFTSSKSLSVYDRKKYVWKLVYIHLLGYDVEFGHREVINLISAPSYAEKTVGYLAASVLLSNSDEQITLIVQSIRNDLQSEKDAFQCLALSAIANIGGRELSESLAPDVQRLLMSRTSFPVVRKRASLCMLRIYRVNPETLPIADWAERICALLDDTRSNLGVVLSFVTLILGVIDHDPSMFERAVPQAVLLLTNLAVSRSCPSDYVYHTTPCPWVQVGLLRFLRYFPLPTDTTLRSRLNDALNAILVNTEVTKSVNKNNGEHAVLFEAINIIIKQGEESDSRLRGLAMKHLSRFINIREPNIRYLGLETMSRIAALEGTGEAIRKQQAAIMVSLKDADISLRRRALDLLFAMCHESNAQDIVKELLTYLVTAEYAIKDEMVLKTAILAERYAPNLRWYVDTFLQLINVAGNHVSDDIWHRVVQIVTNNEDLQAYAARKMYTALQPTNAHESAVKVGSYILGEFGYLLNEATPGGGPDSVQVTGASQFAVLEQHFHRLSSAGKALVLSTFIKMQHLYPELQPAIDALFEKYSDSVDVELQQRAVEYQSMPKVGDDIMTTVLDSMPPFPERESMLEARLRKSKTSATDKDVWEKGTREPGAGSESDDDDSSSSDSEGPAVRAGAGGSSATDADEDLLGLGPSSPKRAAAPTPVPAAASRPDTAAAPAAVAATAPVPVTKRVGLDSSAAPQLRQLFNALAIGNTGKLFEDATIMIGVQSQYSGAQGRMMLYFRNKSSFELTSFKVRVPAQPQVKVEFVDAVPGSIPVGQQVKCQLTAQSFQPFAEAPALQVSFISEPGTGHAYPLRLPVMLTHFVEGVTMAPTDFQTRWGALAGAPKEQSATLSASAASADAARTLLQQLHFTVLDTPGAAAVCGAGSFRTMSKAKTGDFISVGCLVQLTPDAMGSSYHLVVRTQHGDVSQAIVRVVSAQFA